MSERVVDWESFAEFTYHVSNYSLSDIGEGDYFIYFCGVTRDRAVIAEVVEFVDHYPFEDSEADEYITLPTVKLWVEVGRNPDGSFRKVMNQGTLLYDPEFHGTYLDLFDRGYFTICNEGNTFLSYKDADTICEVGYDQEFYIVNRSNAQFLKQFVDTAPPLEPYSP